jgi:hypothetical protein
MVIKGKPRKRKDKRKTERADGPHVWKPQCGVMWCGKERKEEKEEKKSHL